MKLNQNGNTLQIRTNGIGQIITGGFTTILGIGIIIASLLHIANIPTLVSLIGVVFVLISFFVIKSAQNRTVTIESGGATTINAKRLIGGKVEQQSFPTADIAAVRLDTGTDTTTSTDNSQGTDNRQSTLSLMLKNNDIVQLGTARSNSGGLSVNGMNLGNMILKAPLSKEAEQISQFLNVPLQAVDVSSVAGALDAVTNMMKSGNQPAEAPPPTVSQPTSPSTPPTQAPPSVPQTPQTPPVPLPPANQPAPKPPTQPPTAS